MTRRVLTTASALLIALLLVPAAASAHAVLVETVPQRGATLREQPREVVLRFNERVEARFGALRVFDARAERVDDGRVVQPGGSGSRLAVGLKPDLPDGTYVATYRVVSADSHPVSGGLVFSVGEPGDAAAPTVAELIGDSDAGPVTQGVFGLARGLTYLATALVLGGLLFWLAVWLPALRAASGAAESWHAASAAFVRRTRRLLLGAVALGAVGGVAGIVMQGATAGATSGWAALDPTVMRDVLGTRFGEVWGLRVVAFLALGGAIVLALRGARDDGAAQPAALQRVALGADGLTAPRLPRGALALAALPAAFLALAPALGGHAGAQSPVVLSVGLDVAHVLAMSAWIGGLTLLLLALPVATRRLQVADRTRLLAAALLRFSPIALACVAVLLVTGTILALDYVGSWGALTGTGFGRAVLAKAALIGALVGLGMLHRRRVVPRLRALAGAAAPPGATGYLLRRALRAEVALVLIVLGATAALVSYPPPSSLASGPFAGETTLGPLRLEATVDPARVGPNEIHVYLLRARDGAPFDGTRELTVTLTLPAEDIGPLPATAREAGPGHYVIDTMALVPAGEWRLDVVSRVSEFDQYEGSLKVPVQ
ncbi:MAG: copper resistance protein CopC [Solirubrobacteraceae bacterium]|nr:copper resistance protein CopC [Solirubrobacteraceae bacterium]